MDKYLLEILKEIKTIIIPNLGALTITNEDTGEIMFMPYLKHDDNKLSDYIAQHEGMEENDAKNLIAKYVREINAELDKGEEYSMYNFGSFVKNEDGDIEFINWSQKNDTSSETPVDKADDKPEKTEEVIYVTENVEEETAEVSDDPETIEKDDNKEEALETVAEPIIEEVKESVSENKSEPVYTTERELNIEEKEELEKNSEKLAGLRKVQEAKQSERKKRGAGFYILIVLIVLITAGGTYFGLNYQSLKQHIPFLADNSTEYVSESDELDKMKELIGEEDDTEVVEASTEETNTEEIIAEETEEIVDDKEIVEEFTEEQVETKVEKVINAPSSNNPYHIIVGAFGDESNAERLGEKLRNKGYNVKVGPGKGLTLVSIGSYSSHDEAQSAISSFGEDASNAWIYKWN